MLNAGDLRTRGVLQQRSNASDSQGGQIVTWIDVATLWAQVVATQGMEGFTADQQRPLVMYDVTIRYRPGVTGSAYGADPSMRFVTGPRVFDIRSVIDTDERHEELVLGCELYVP